MSLANNNERLSVNMNPKSNEVISIVNAETAAAIICDMVETDRADLGHSFVISGTHPTLGKIVVFNSAEGKSAYLGERRKGSANKPQANDDFAADRKFG